MLSSYRTKLCAHVAVFLLDDPYDNSFSLEGVGSVDVDFVFMKCFFLFAA